MGDVAMTVPVIKNLLTQHPNLKVTVVSNAFLQPLFEGLERCDFHPAFLKQQHNGAAGIFRLFKELKSITTFDTIIDLHSVLRSQLLTTFFKLAGLKTATVDKGRREKKALTRKHNKVMQPLVSMHERYAAVFRKAGFALQLKYDKPIFQRQTIPAALQAVFLPAKKIIGIAPFAQYQEKMYPIEKMKSVVQQMAAANYYVLLFGGGSAECTILQQWEQEIFSVFNVAGKYALKDELAIISNLDAMISMDSANMHLASLFGVPVVSIWGATHYFAGFNGWAQKETNMVQTDLYCRPCSVFGNKPCYRGDHACMQGIEVAAIIEKIKAIG